MLVAGVDPGLPTQNSYGAQPLSLGYYSFWDYLMHK